MLRDEARPRRGRGCLRSLRHRSDSCPGLPFDDACAVQYARLCQDLERDGTPIGPNDVMIAATALSTDLTLVTHNVSEFSRVIGVKIEDWQ